MEDFNPAPYMRWAKYRPDARYDLAGSSLVACKRDDAPGIMERSALYRPRSGRLPAALRGDRTALRRRAGTDRARRPGARRRTFSSARRFFARGMRRSSKHPVYDPLPAAARMVGARIAHFERRFEDGWSVDPDRVARAMTKRTRLVIISSPHNPSGVVVPQEIIRALGDVAEKNEAWILVDEVYRDAMYDCSWRSSALAHPRCIATNSLTKSYGLPGLRCGWAMGARMLSSEFAGRGTRWTRSGVYAAEVASPARLP